MWFSFELDSFNVEITTDVQLIGPWEVIIFSVTLLGVLSGFYFALIGHGRHSPWGLIHHLLRYFPVEHIKRRHIEEGQEGRKDDASMIISEKTNGPNVSEILEIYLDRFEHARYDS